MASLKSQEAVCERLVDVLRALESIRGGIDANDLESIRRSIVDLRKNQRLLKKAKAAAKDAKIPLTVDGIDLILSINEVTKAINEGLRHFAEWAKRPLPPAAELLATEAGTALIADVVVPVDFESDCDLVVLIGAGAGPLAREVIARGHERVAILVPDGSPEQLRELTQSVPSDVLVAGNYIELRNAVAHVPFPWIKRVKSFCLGEPDEEILRESAEAAKDGAMAAQAGRSTVEFLGELWAIQGVVNLPHVAKWPTTTVLRGAFENRPCVIVSPGPSLRKNVEQLRQLKGKAVIISVSHAISALTKAGVVPDLVMNVDPQDVRYFFKDSNVDQVGAVVLGATCFPGLYELPARRFVTMAANSADAWAYGCLDDNPVVGSGGSVSCSAFALALQMACNPIILVGQDLAFEEGKVYVDSCVDGGQRFVSDGRNVGHFTGQQTELMETTRYLKRGTPNLRHMEVPGANGGTVQTMFAYYLFLRWFQAMATQHPHVRLLNCTEGGAFIKGFEHLPLARVIAENASETVDVESVLDGVVRGVDRADRYSRMLAQAETLLTSVDRSASLASRCSRAAQKARRRPDLLPKLSSLEKELVTALKPMVFASMIEQKDIREALEANEEARSIRENLDASERLYTVVTSIAARIRPDLVKTLGVLREAGTEESAMAPAGIAVGAAAASEGA